MSAQRKKNPERKWSKKYTIERRNLHNELEHWKSRAIIAEEILDEITKKREIKKISMIVLGFTAFLTGVMAGIIITSL